MKIDKDELKIGYRPNDKRTMSARKRYQNSTTVVVMVDDLDCFSRSWWEI